MTIQVNWFFGDCRFELPHGLKHVDDITADRIRPGDILIGGPYGLTGFWFVISIEKSLGWQQSKYLSITVLDGYGLVTVKTYLQTLVRRLRST